MSSFAFHVAGVSYREIAIRQLINDPCAKTVTLEAEPGNQYDSNAIKVMVNGVHIGYVPKTVNSNIRLPVQHCFLEGMNTFHAGVYAKIRIIEDIPETMG